MKTYQMTDMEKAIFYKLTEAGVLFKQLPVQHETHLPDFIRAINAAKRILMARPTDRYYELEEPPLQHIHELQDSFED